MLAPLTLFVALFHCVVCTKKQHSARYIIPSIEDLLHKTECAITHLQKFDVPLPFIISSVQQSAFKHAPKMAYLPYKKCFDYRHPLIELKNPDPSFEEYFKIVLNFQILEASNPEHALMYLKKVWPGAQTKFTDYSQVEKVVLAQSSQMLSHHRRHQPIIKTNFIILNSLQLFLPGDKLFVLDTVDRKTKINEHICIIYASTFEGGQCSTQLLGKFSYKSIIFPKTCPCLTYFEPMDHLLSESTILDMFYVNEKDCGTPCKWEMAKKWFKMFQLNGFQLTSILDKIMCSDDASKEIMSIILNFYHNSGRFKSFQLFFGLGVRFMNIRDMSSQDASILFQIFKQKKLVFGPGTKISKDFVLKKEQYAIPLDIDTNTCSLALINSFMVHTSALNNHADPVLQMIHSPLMYHLYLYNVRNRKRHLIQLFEWAIEKKPKEFPKNEKLLFIVLNNTFITNSRSLIVAFAISRKGKRVVEIEPPSRSNARQPDNGILISIDENNNCFSLIICKKNNFKV